MAGLALTVRKTSKINWMLERASSRILFGWSSRVVEHRVADVAIIPDELACIANMLTIMAAKTARGIKMSDVIRVRLPISLHLRKEVGLKDTLNLFRAGLD